MHFRDLTFIVSIQEITNSELNGTIRFHLWPFLQGQIKVIKSKDRLSVALFSLIDYFNTVSNSLLWKKSFIILKPKLNKATGGSTMIYYALIVIQTLLGSGYYLYPGASAFLWLTQCANFGPPPKKIGRRANFGSFPSA